MNSSGIWIDFYLNLILHIWFHKRFCQLCSQNSLTAIPFFHSQCCLPINWTEVTVTYLPSRISGYSLLCLSGGILRHRYGQAIPQPRTSSGSHCLQPSWSLACQLEPYHLWSPRLISHSPKMTLSQTTHHLCDWAQPLLDVQHFLGRIMSWAYVNALSPPSPPLCPAQDLVLLEDAQKQTKIERPELTWAQLHWWMNDCYSEDSEWSASKNGDSLCWYRGLLMTWAHLRFYRST